MFSASDSRVNVRLMMLLIRIAAVSAITTQPTDFPTEEPSLTPVTSYMMSTFVGGGYSFDNGSPARSTYIQRPFGLWGDTSGGIYYSDINQHCVRRVDNENIVWNIAGVCGQSGDTDGLPATASLLNNPQNVAVDSMGSVYIASGNKVKKVDYYLGIMSTFAGNGLDGFVDDFASTSSAIGMPQALWINNAGQIYFSAYSFSLGAHYLNLVTSDGTMYHIAGNSDGVYGDGFAATSTKIPDMSFLAGDSSGRIVFADGQDKVNGGHVRSIEQGTLKTIMGTGVWAYNGEGLPATSVDLMNPNGVAIDESTGDIFTSLYDGQRVMKLTASTGRVNTIAGFGDQGEGVDGGPAILGAVMGPYALWFNQTRGLFVADSFYGKVRLIYEPRPTANSTVIPTPSPTPFPTFGPTSFVAPTASTVCYWSAEEEDCGGSLTEVVVSSSSVSSTPTVTTTTTITKTFRKKN